MRALKFVELTIRVQRTTTLVVVLMIAAAMIGVSPLLAADDTGFTKQQIKDFLLHARVVASRQTTTGITHPFRLTLSDGRIEHDAAFESVDEHKQEVILSTGGRESDFVDSYKYDLAGYILAEMVGFDDMVPVYVERTWNGRTGSLSWWVPTMMDDQERYLRQIQPPDMNRWNRQIEKLRLFNLLIEESDPNLTNILIDKDWKVWRIDFSRAFRLHTDLQIPKDLQHCERRFFQQLKSLDAKELATRTRNYIGEAQLQAVMARRDKIVAHFQSLIADKGENEVLY